MGTAAGLPLRETPLAPPGPRLLVVSGDPDRRERWARALAETGYAVSRCVGPTGTSRSSSRALRITDGARAARRRG